jgi:uncharacterized protein (TIGR03435 family)
MRRISFIPSWVGFDRRTSRRLAACLSVLAVNLTLFGQILSSKKPSFDVATVKMNLSGGPPRRTGTLNNRFIAENVPLSLLIQYAYRPSSGVLFRQHVIGGPTWIDSDRFDIEAKLDAETPSIPTKKNWLMVQSLLEDRFQLRVHYETRELPVYDLVVAKTGLKMGLSSDQTIPRSEDEDDDGLFPTDAPPRGESFVKPSPSGTIIVYGTAIPIVPDPNARRSHSLLPLGLTTLLAGRVGRPVIDKTNLNGLFDFRLEFSGQTASLALSDDSDSGPSIFTAVQNQLGLKLESSKAPVDVLIIDSVQRLRPN